MIEMSTKKVNRRHDAGRQWSFLAFVLPILICGVVLILDGVYPFGDRCILHVDMYHQYCPFFTEFMHKLKSGESLMYSWKIGLGSDFFSVFVYYLSSPLNWLLYFCPENHVIEFMTILILFKIGFSGYAFYRYLDYRFAVPEKLPSLVFAAAYAVSGFTAAYAWDIMWMDCIMLAPLIFIGLEKLMRERRPAMYYITLALAILCNYYMSIMICIFLCFYFAALFFEMEETAGHGRLKGLGRFALYSLLAGGTGIVLMYPEMIILGASGSSGFRFPQTIEWYFGILEQIPRMCAGAASYTSTQHWPNLYAGTFSILLAVLYVLCGGIPLRKRLSRLFMVLFFLVSFANNWLDFIWHGLHFPDSLPGRQSFLFIFLLLVMGYEVFLHREELAIWQILLGTALAEALLTGSLWVMNTDVTAKEAVYVSIALTGVYGLALFLGRISEPSRKFACLIICFAAIMELSCNMYLTGFSTTSRTTYMAKMDRYQKLLEEAEADAAGQQGITDGSKAFFRAEDTERLCKNDDTRYGYASATQFSSLMNINVSHFYQKLFMEGGKNYYCYNGATPLTSAMLSVGYYLSDSDALESDLRTLIAEEDGLYLYRNRYCLPMGYVIPETSAALFEASQSKKIDGINTLATVLGAEGSLLRESACESEAGEGETTLHFDHSGYYYAASVKCDADSLTFRYEDGTNTGWSKATHSYLFDIGYMEAGSSVRITNRKSETIEFLVYELDMESLDQAYSTLASQTVENLRVSADEVSCSIRMEEGGRLVFPIANESGWTMYIDERQVEIESFADTFISQRLDPGTYEIVLRYETPGLKEGMIASSICVLLFVVLMLIRRIGKQ